MAEFFEKSNESVKETEDEVKRAEEFFLKDSKRVDMNLYAEWMRDWLLQGNELDTDCAFGHGSDIRSFYQISDGAIITPLYGANSVTLIAAKGTHFTILETGHSVVFYWDESGTARWAGWGEPCPELTYHTQRRLEKMNDPVLNEILKKNLEKRGR
jgi:hypothetical protein